MSKRLVTSLFMIVLLFITLSNAPASLAARISGVIKPVRPGFRIEVAAFSKDKDWLHRENSTVVDPETGQYVVTVYKPGIYNLLILGPLFGLISVETGVSHTELTSNGRSAIEQVLTDMSEAVNRKDVNRLMNHYSQKYYALTGTSYANKSAQLEKEIGQFKEGTFSRHICLMEGNEDAVAVIYRAEFEPVKRTMLLDPNALGRRAFDEIVWFEKEAGNWKIKGEQKIPIYLAEGDAAYYYVRYPGPDFPCWRYVTDPNLVGIEVETGKESTGHNYTLPAEVVDIGIKMQRMLVKGRRAACLSNLKQIGLGLHMYAMDHNEAFPEDIRVLYPTYISSAKIFKCPNDESISDIKEITRGTRISYVYVPGLTTKDGSDNIVAYDASPDFHGGEGRDVLFLDGHVKWYAEEEFQKLLNKNKAK